MADDDKQVPKVTLPNVQVAAGQPVQPQPAGKFKEQEGGPAFAKATAGEATKGEGIEEIQEIPSQVEVEKKPELAGFVESVKNEDILVTPVVDDYTQEILLKQINSGTGVVTLPLTEAEIKEDVHKGIWESVRWLAVWCVRQIKLLHGKVTFKKE